MVSMYVHILVVQVLYLKKWSNVEYSSGLILIFEQCVLLFCFVFFLLVYLNKLVRHIFSSRTLPSTRKSWQTWPFMNLERFQ